MVSWCFGYLGSPYERDFYLGVSRFESQTTGLQTTNWPLVEVASSILGQADHAHFSTKLGGT